ncbi:hypothetical protein [uncultured Microbacterium sp.]|uniref:hypothetical protein n=1 Tax=uncultured Microbacterium sp. TaxID=191216 RepID=UPI0025EE1590|nr:hypothetical protein [uncultured Microbacterium sp.]
MTKFVERNEMLRNRSRVLASLVGIASLGSALTSCPWSPNSYFPIIATEGREGVIVGGRVYFVQSEEQFDVLRARIAKVCDVSSVLPAWPFRNHGYAYTYDFLAVLSRGFGSVLQYIATECGDGGIEVMGWGRGEALEYFGVYPAFAIDAEGIERMFELALSADRVNPRGRYNVPEDMFEGMVVVGDSESWCLYGDRDWDIVLIWSEIPLDLEAQALKPMTFEDFLSPLRPTGGPGGDHSIWRQLYSNVRANSWDA